MSEAHGHIGGVAFTREPDKGMLGFGVSNVMWSDHITYPSSPGSFSDQGLSLWRVGPLAQYYVNDKFTIGAGAFYLTGNSNLNSGSPATYTDTGYDGNLFAKFYPNNSWAITLRGDLDHLNFQLANSSYYYNLDTQVGTLEAEYLFANSPISAFFGGRFAHQHYVDLFNTVQDQNDIQGFVGVNIALGSAPRGSLRDRDRNGLIDNTSVGLEKVPDLVGGFGNINNCTVNSNNC